MPEVYCGGDGDGWGGSDLYKPAESLPESTVFLFNYCSFTIIIDLKDKQRLSSEKTSVFLASSSLTHKTPFLT
jgi:hypothetical protein